MKKLIVLFLIAFTFIIFFVLSTEKVNSENAGDFKYVGTVKCMECHKSGPQGEQYDIWKASKHSHAYETLTTNLADEIAKQKGFTTKASETPACLKCHVLGKDIVETELTETFNIEDGVQCESCHGPGSEYKYAPIMKDKQKSGENGLIIHREKEKFCVTCHNSDSPTYKEFNYDTYWEQIKHPLPKSLK